MNSTLNPNNVFRMIDNTLSMVIDSMIHDYIPDVMAFLQSWHDNHIHGQGDVGIRLDKRLSNFLYMNGSECSCCGRTKSLEFHHEYNNKDGCVSVYIYING